MWKDVNGYSGLYKVNENGDIFSIRAGKNLKPNLLRSGYYQYSLRKDGKRKLMLGHRVVAEAFVDNPDGYPIINHKNEIKTDNRADNLEWCTISYNQKYGTLPERRRKSGAWKKGVEVSKKAVTQINRGVIIETFESISEASRKTGINLSNISQCCKGNRKAAGGYSWIFEEVKTC